MTKKNYFLKVGFLTILFFVSAIGWAQPSIGGTPPSFLEATQLKSKPQAYSLKSPNVKLLLEEDKNSNGAPRAAKIIETDLTLADGSWSKLSNGQYIWRISIEAAGAKALVINYKRFYIPKGGKLFIYNQDGSQILGAYTSANNTSAEFSTELVAGDFVTLEYVAPLQIQEESTLFDRNGNKVPANKLKPQPTEQPIIDISGIAYFYNNLISVTRNYDNRLKTPNDRGSSGNCMVNINCSEGENWQTQKKGIAATLQKIGTSYYICSGTLVNNLANDLTPYFLMAQHCNNASGVQSSAADYNQYQFYFHWEENDCARGSATATYRTMTGCQFMAESALHGGSDGLLLRLNTQIPVEYDLYFNGWDATNVSQLTTPGVGIHHPSGDVKKISSYNSAISTTANLSTGEIGATNAFYGFVFVATENGHGVTEGGSSGSPLFNTAGLVVGTLTGGSSSCTNTSGTNLYGKVSYHFDNGGFRAFLDPNNTGATVCQGRYVSTDPIANFTATSTNIYAMQAVQFVNQSYNATSYQWSFPGGTPSSSTERDPKVYYNTPGTYSVTLSVDGGVSTKVSTDYIKVTEKTDGRDLQIGTATATNNFPLGYARNFGKTHQATLYTASELGEAADITAIQYYTTTARTSARSVNIYMMHTNATDITSIEAWGTNGFKTAHPTAVLVAQYTNWSNTAGWQKFDFNVEKFPYDGINNVVVITEVWGAANASISASVTPGVRYTVGGTDNNRYFTATYNTETPSTATTNNQRPNVILTMEVEPKVPVAKFTGPVAVEVLETENFDALTDATFPPAGWETVVSNALSQWSLGNPTSNSFNTVDVNNINSVLCSYIAIDHDERLITKVIPVLDDTYKLQFYAGYAGFFLSAAQLNCKVATEDGQYNNWETVWTSGATDTGVEFTWFPIECSLAAYAGKNIKVMFQYVGNDGDLMCLDEVKIGVGDPLGKFSVKTDEPLALVDQSTGPVTVWNWELPGSTTPTLQSFGEVPQPIYEMPGTYDIALTVSNLKGTNTLYKAEQVIVTESPTLTDFTAKGGYEVMGNDVNEFRSYIVPGEKVLFTDNSKNSPKSWAWMFEHGTPANAATQSAEVAYNQEGTHSVSLTTKNSSGSSTKVVDNLVVVGYGEERATNLNIKGGALGNYTVGTNIYLGGSGIGTMIAERYKAPATAIQISSVTAHVAAKGFGSKEYMMQIVLPNEAGAPEGNVLASITYDINQLATAPSIETFRFDVPVNIPAGQPFFVRVSNFASYNATNYHTFMTSIGNSIPTGEISTAWSNYQNAWLPLSRLLTSTPMASYALWPNITYTQLDVASAAVTVGESAGTVDVEVKSNLEFVATTDATWFAVAVNGDKVVVTYQQNTTGAERTGSITVTAGAATKSIQVTQLATDNLTLSVTDENYNLPNTEGTFNIEVVSNVQWSVSTNATWITLDNKSGSGNGKIVATYTNSEYTTEREATITLMGGGITKAVKVTQASLPAYLTLSSEAAQAHKLNGTGNFLISSNVEWAVSSSAEWLTVDAKNGKGNALLFYQYATNSTSVERTGVIVVTANNQTATFVVTQAAGSGEFIVAPDALYFNNAGGSNTITLTSNAGWSAVIPQDAMSWLTLSKTAGDAGSETVTVTASASTVATRSTTIQFNNGYHYRYLQISQTPDATLTTSTTTLTATPGAEVLSFNVVSNIAWNVQSDAAWATLSTGAGSNNATVQVSVESNPAATQRTAIITVSGGGISRQIAIVQQEQGSSITNPELDHLLMSYNQDRIVYVLADVSLIGKTVHLYNLAGMQLKSQVVDSNLLNLGTVEPGVYIIRVDNRVIKTVVR